MALEAEDLEFVNEGVRITVRRSKTDQEDVGRVKAIGFGTNGVICPLRALQSWLYVSEICGGPLRPISRWSQLQPSRLTDNAASLVIKRAAQLAGIDADSVNGHSLRAGFVTDQYACGTPENVVMQQTGHRSTTVMGICPPPGAYS